MHSRRKLMIWSLGPWHFLDQRCAPIRCFTQRRKPRRRITRGERFSSFKLALQPGEEDQFRRTAIFLYQVGQVRFENLAAYQRLGRRLFFLGNLQAQIVQDTFQRLGEFANGDNLLIALRLEIVQHRSRGLSHEIRIEILHGLADQLNRHFFRVARNEFAIGCLKNQGVGM